MLLTIMFSAIIKLDLLCDFPDDRLYSNVDRKRKLNSGVCASNKPYYAINLINSENTIKKYFWIVKKRQLYYIVFEIRLIFCIIFKYKMPLNNLLGLFEIKIFDIKMISNIKKYFVI